MKKIFEASISFTIDLIKNKLFHTKVYTWDFDIPLSHYFYTNDKKSAKHLLELSDQWRDENLVHLLETEYDFEGMEYTISNKVSDATEIKGASLLHLMGQMQAEDFFEYCSGFIPLTNTAK